jgi:hypothetical protein
MVLPAIVLVLACCLSAVQLAGRQLRLQDAAAAAARSSARGDGVEVASRLVPGAAASRWHDGELECVRLTSTAALLGTFMPVELTATSCAPGGGR